MTEHRNCIKCNVELILDDNWYSSSEKVSNYTCINCARAQVKKWVRNNRENRMLLNARSRAKTKCIDFDLELSDITIPEYCPLLGIKLQTAEEMSEKRADNSPTLDRIDNSRGYVKGNVWVVSYIANAIMTSATHEQIIMVGEGLKKKMESMVDPEQIPLL